MKSGSLSRIRMLLEANGAFLLLARVEIKLDEFFRFLRSRAPLPFFYGINRRLYQ
jgi:hypothetical protein